MPLNIDVSETFKEVKKKKRTRVQLGEQLEEEP
jgi:hypothetical protein